MKVRINEAEEILKGAEKLSAQLNKSEWAKMPKVKEDKVKEYVVVKPIMDVPAEKIKVTITEFGDCVFNAHRETLAIDAGCIKGLIEQGIIAEKKSKAEEIVFNICQKYWQSTADDYRVKRLSDIILEELEKAGVE